MKTSGVLQSVPAEAQDTPIAAAAMDAPSDLPGRSTLKIAWAAILLLAALSVLALCSALLSLWQVWATDPLQSIGLLIVPLSLGLTFRAWRQTGGQLRGTWWGLLPVALGLLIANFQQVFASSLRWDLIDVDLVGPKVALYLFVSGIVILFAGFRVWRLAWFPLLLLLCARPVPSFASRYLDLPLQNLSAHIARSFATLIGFPPTSKELLRLMFTPSFGMFIAPGCDGVRGAATLGYFALITGYLKKVSIPRWIAYVTGAVFLGYLFNLFRLCALVLYYRLALGHPRFEQIAKQADYAIGGCLFLFAVLLFLWVAFRNDEKATAVRTIAAHPSAPRTMRPRTVAFALLALLFAVPGVNAIRNHRITLASAVIAGSPRAASLDALLPQKFGAYTLTRISQETTDNQVKVESGAYVGVSPDEIILGVWVPPTPHTIHQSLMVRGEDPFMRADKSFLTAQNRSILFDTALYSDGVTDTFAGNVYCTLSECVPSQPSPKLDLQFILNPTAFEKSGGRAVSIFFRIDSPHTTAAASAVYQDLEERAQHFLLGVDFGELSRRFQ